MRALAAVILALWTVAPPAMAGSLDGEAWKEMLAGIDADLQRRGQEVAAMNAALPEISARAQAALTDCDNMLTQTLLLRGLAGDNPWTMRTLMFRFSGLSKRLEDASRRIKLLKEHLARVKEENATLREIRRKGMDVAYDDATVNDLAEHTRKLAPIKAQVDVLQARVNEILGHFEALSSQVADANNGLVKDYRHIFKGHFFDRSHPVTDTFGAVLLASVTRDWLADFPRFAVPILAGTRWGPLLLFGVVAWAALLLLGAGVARRFSLHGDAELRRGWTLFSLGLAFFMGSRYVPITSSHILNLMLVTAVFAGGWLMLRRHYPEGGLGFFLAVYCAGVVTQMLNMPPELIAVVWPPVMGLAGWNRWLAGEKSVALRLWVAGVAALLGFAPLAVALVQAWFILRLMVAAARGLKKLLAGAGGMWFHYVHPLAVTVLVVLYLCWVLVFMGGPGFVDYVFELQWELGPVKLSLDALSSMVVLFFAVRLLLAWVGAFLEEVSFGGKPLDPALSHTLTTLCSYTLWLAFFLVGLHQLGLPLSGLTWIASGLSVGVGFGLKDIINNFVSGLIILFGGSIKKGDVVQTGKLLGEVTNVSVRNTTVRTMDNSMVIIPNSSFLRGEIINWSFQDKRIRLTVPVSVIPGTKVKKVRKILLETAGENAKVLKDPAPSVVLRQLGKLGLDFELYVWIEDFRAKFDVESELAASIDQALQDAKITVAFQGAKVKYKPKGSEESQREAAREALREKRHKVFSLVRPLRRVHMRAKWGVPASVPAEDES
ncbi:mechanosensitive ion channel family protein [Fundidesulfovibrio agrisoli]|uniref:mechanosensitive ion channel family protein n=1 Tax=Fundidesulfovibrio agrisoli TaxID=2922717 RepID=UPI001FADF8C9|nr:mechanosensitive ion channel domain-containing protein [Fundidesulfovibrio agrisoli]